MILKRNTNITLNHHTNLITLKHNTNLITLKHNTYPTLKHNTYITLKHDPNQITLKHNTNLTLNHYTNLITLKHNTNLFTLETLTRMADFGFARFGEDEENEEEEGQGYTSTTKDGLIFLIDCSKSMFDSEDEDQESHFQLCIKCAKTTLQNKIISSDKDLIGVVFFGTDKAKNTSDFKHIYIYQELDQPGAPRILELEDMLESM
ncbi:G22P1 [Mytilus edulis]|uniref:XRCC6 n=1 Tax=Mytilus edulis TaxID=6550 RepID=A0A8S3QFS5_MYTED|nr:G22P1 [Mytilus edulis]